MAEGGLAVLERARHPVAAGTVPRLRRGSEGPGLSCTAAVMTAQGLRPAGGLRPGDRVLTRDRGFLPLRGIAAVASAEAGAVHVAAGALGRGLPQGDLLLAPHQLVLVEGPGAAELVAAGALLGSPGIGCAPAAALVALTLDGHELIWAEGAWCASAPLAAALPLQAALQGCAGRLRHLA